MSPPIDPHQSSGGGIPQFDELLMSELFLQSLRSVDFLKFVAAQSRMPRMRSNPGPITARQSISDAEFMRLRTQLLQ